MATYKFSRDGATIARRNIDLVTALTLTGPGTTAIAITDVFTNGINFSGTITNPLVFSGTITTAITIGACTTGILFSGTTTDAIKINADATTAINITASCTPTTGLLIAGASADAILISGACSDNAIEITGVCTGSAIEIVTGGFGIGLNVNADGTTGIAVANTFSGTTMLALAGTASDGINISGICADGIEISAAATTTGLNVSADCVTGITIAAQTTAGITIGSTTTGIAITGTVAKGVDTTDAILTQGWNNAFFACGSGNGSSGDQHSAAVTDFYIPIQVNMVSTAGPVAPSEVCAAMLRVDASTADQANSSCDVLCIRSDIAKNVYAATCINASLNISDDIAVPTATVQGIYVAMTGSGTITSPNTVNVAEFVYKQTGTVTDGCDNVCEIACNASGCTIADILHINNYGGTVTNGINIDGTMSKGIDLTGMVLTQGWANGFITIGSGNGSSGTQHSAAVTDVFIPIQVNIASTAGPAAPSEVGAAMFRADAITADQANTSLDVLMLRSKVDKNVYAATCINASLEISDDISVPTATVQGIYVAMTGSGTITSPNTVNVAEFVYKQTGTVNNGCDNVAEIACNASGCTIADILHLSNYGGTVTNGINIVGTMTTGIAISDGCTTGIALEEDVALCFGDSNEISLSYTGEEFQLDDSRTLSTHNYYRSFHVAGSITMAATRYASVSCYTTLTAGADGIEAFGGKFSLAQTSTNTVTGYFGAVMAEVKNASTSCSTACALFLRWDNEAATGFGEVNHSFIRLDDNSSQTKCSNLFEMYLMDATAGAANDVIVCQAGSAATASHVIKITANGVPYWIGMSSTPPA